MLIQSTTWWRTLPRILTSCLNVGQIICESRRLDQIGVGLGCHDPEISLPAFCLDSESFELNL